MCTVPLLDRICRESYNHPDAVYDRLKHRGMDLVTITDHDSIDAVEPLRKYPDFFLSEEVSAASPAPGCTSASMISASIIIRRFNAGVMICCPWWLI